MLGRWLLRKRPRLRPTCWTANSPQDLRSLIWHSASCWGGGGHAGFDTIVCGIFRLQAHTDRLFRSAHILRMKMPYEREAINAAHCAVVRDNNLKEAYLRPLAFLGSEAMGLRAEGLATHVAVAAWEWPSYMDPEARERGIKVRCSSYTRHHVNVTMCKAKAVGA